MVGGDGVVIHGSPEPAARGCGKQGKLAGFQEWPRLGLPVISGRRPGGRNPRNPLSFDAWNLLRNAERQPRSPPPDY